MAHNKHFSRLMLAVFIWTIAFGATIQPAYAASTHTDIDGHWAQGHIENLTAQAVISGYPDGTFKPEKSITRAEFATALVKAFKLENKNGKLFGDTAGHWARDYIATAHAAGIVSGYSEAAFGPDDLISREQMAVMIVKAAGLENTAGGKAFADAGGISAWAQAAVSTAGGHNVISGYPDNTFRPQGSATRAEAAVVLHNAISATPGKTEAQQDYSAISKAGTYGPASGTETVTGNVSVQSPGVILQNLIIQGDLTIAKEVGGGDATLNNISVKGKTYIRGGGAGSIHIKGGQYSEILVEKTATGAVRIAVVDNSGLLVTLAQSAAGEKIILSGEIARLTVNADNAAVATQTGAKIGELKVAGGLTGVSIDLAENSSVNKMTLESKTTVKGKGTIKEADGSKAKESSFATAPDKITSTSGGGGGGGSSSPATSASVGTAAQLTSALANSNISTITLTADIAASPSITRSLSMNFGAYTLTGNLTFQHNLSGTSVLTGDAGNRITGSLSVKTPNASFKNGVTVGGTVTVADIEAGTWTESADGNTLTITDPNGATITITGSPGAVTITEDAGGNLTLTVNEGATVSSITTNAPVNITVAAGATVTAITAAAGSGGSTITNNGNTGTLTVNDSIVSVKQRTPTI